MFDKLDEIKNKYAELTKLISQPDVIVDQNKWTKLVKEHSSLTEIVETYDSLLAMKKDLSEAEDLLKLGADEEMTLLLEDEVKRLRHLIPETEEKLKILLLPKDPDDDNNVIIEIRAGAGGDEAALFAAEAQRMYYRYAERQRWKTEEIDINESELGGVKEVTFSVIGKGAYSRLKYESGVHRVQRVPATESQGRIHTSTITVAVLPEGQDERSQIKNRDKAMKTLKSKLYDFYRSQAEKEYSQTRRMQIGTGDRSERIRTYNFPQGRVTDHRISLTLYSLDEFLDGDLDQMIEALRLADQTAKLQGNG